MLSNNQAADPMKTQAILKANPKAMPAQHCPTRQIEMDEESFKEWEEWQKFDKLEITLIPPLFSFPYPENPTISHYKNNKKFKRKNTPEEEVEVSIKTPQETRQSKQTQKQCGLVVQGYPIQDTLNAILQTAEPFQAIVVQTLPARQNQNAANIPTSSTYYDPPPRPTPQDQNRRVIGKPQAKMTAPKAKRCQQCENNDPQIKRQKISD